MIKGAFSCDSGKIHITPNCTHTTTRNTTKQNRNCNHENSNKPSLRARIRQNGRGNQTTVNQILKKKQ